MVKVDPAPAFFRPAKHHQNLACSQHLLYVMLIEPTTDQPAAQSDAFSLVQRSLYNVPPGEIARGHLVHDPSHANRFFGAAAWQPAKFSPIFSPPRISSHQ